MAGVALNNMALSNQLSHKEVGVVESLHDALLNDLHEAENSIAVLVLHGEVPVLSEKDAVGLLLQAHCDGDPYASFNLCLRLPRRPRSFTLQSFKRAIFFLRHARGIPHAAHNHRLFQVPPDEGLPNGPRGGGAGLPPGRPLQRR